MWKFPLTKKKTSTLDFVIKDEKSIEKKKYSTEPKKKVVKNFTTNIEKIKEEEHLSKGYHSSHSVEEKRIERELKVLKKYTQTYR